MVTGGNTRRINKVMCTHHWIIDSPNGESSRGVCLRCGEKRIFSNSLDKKIPSIITRSQKLYARRETAGLCVVCGHDKESERWKTCNSCRQNARDRQRQRYIERSKATIC